MSESTPNTPEENAHGDIQSNDISLSSQLPSNASPADVYNFTVGLRGYIDDEKACPSFARYPSIAKALVRSPARDHLQVLKPLIKKAYAIKHGKKRREIPFTVERVLRYIEGFKCYEDYFNPKKTSFTAHKLSGFMHYFSVRVPDAKVGRLPLYAFDRFYRPEGDMRIAEELERVWSLMHQKATFIHKQLDNKIRLEISQTELNDNKDSHEVIKILKQFLSMPDDLEIRSLQIDEIGGHFRGKNARRYSELNQPPDGSIFRIAISNCEIEGALQDGKLKIQTSEFNPDHLVTYALNANLSTEGILKQAKEWFEFTQRVLGSDGAMQFYEFVGYLMVTTYPLPTERTIAIIVGDPGSGKGTHLAAVQALLTVDGISLFAKAAPHKFTNKSEHFSYQNLANKLLITHGDIPHTNISDFSPVNDLLGGEPQEMEKKFRDPSTEIPIFKALWASTTPLLRVYQSGGLYRRAQLLFTQPVPHGLHDDTLKQKMLSMLDGFFYNALMGLSRLAVNNWKFTNEISNEELEKLWAFHSDSIRVWAQNLNPEDENVEVATLQNATLDGKKERKDVIENIQCRMLVDDLYNNYKEWCKKKQVGEMGSKTFSAWLTNNGFTIKRKVLENGGQRTRVTYASWSTAEDGKDQPGAQTKFNLPFEDVVNASPLNLVGMALEVLEAAEPPQETKKEFEKAMPPMPPMPQGNEPYILLSLKDDFAASWFDKDWYFHKCDVVHVPEGLANLLINRNIARKVEL